ncbi:protein TIME FOR COFFEE-like [Pyrus ussuriensis x Pyrus communis]|uniref:Protein TIME FOR COFFEE-like n=1 Tax=Pyrus ussuriensis x Pyrus communis TaxID=2448454 RepID=A0A5N5HLE0_9ROSA|nr:protein TIME FOR COFFEE-like [Pyrus ussuriensis x Pyrus communis]
MFEFKEANNKSTYDAKSRVSSLISNSPCTVPQRTSPFPQNSSSSDTFMSIVGGNESLGVSESKQSWVHYFLW